MSTRRVVKVKQLVLLFVQPLKPLKEQGFHLGLTVCKQMVVLSGAF